MYNNKMIELGFINNETVYFKMIKIESSYNTTYKFSFAYNAKNFISDDNLYDIVSDGYDNLDDSDKLGLLEYHDCRPSEVIDEIISDSEQNEIIDYIVSWLDDNDICYDEVKKCEDTGDYYYLDMDSAENVKDSDLFKIDCLQVSHSALLDMMSLYNLCYCYDMVNNENANYHTVSLQQKIEKIWNKY